MATAMGVLASTGALRTHISQLFSFFLVHLLEIYTCSSNTQIYSTLGGTLVPTRYARGTLSCLLIGNELTGSIFRPIIQNLDTTLTVGSSTREPYTVIKKSIAFERNATFSKTGRVF